MKSPTHHRPRRTLLLLWVRRFLVVASAVLAACAAVALLSLWLPGSAPVLVAVHAAAGMWLLVAAVAVVLAWLSFRDVAVVAASAVMVAWMLVASAQLSAAAHVSDPGLTPGVRVAAANVLVTNTATAEVAADLVALDADVVVVSETSDEWRSALEAHWVGRYQVVADVAATWPRGTAESVDGSDVTIWASVPPVSSGTLPFGSLQLPWAHFESTAGSYTVVGIHLSAPDTSWSLQDWEAQLAALGSWASSQSGCVVLAGDFNASTTNPQMAPLLSAFSDAAAASAVLWPPTWPADRIPVLSLDHVLVTDDVAVTGFGVVDVSGSDHRGVYADLATGC